ARAAACEPVVHQDDPAHTDHGPEAEGEVLDGAESPVKGRPACHRGHRNCDTHAESDASTVKTDRPASRTRRAHRAAGPAYRRRSAGGSSSRRAPAIARECEAAEGKSTRLHSSHC